MILPQVILAYRLRFGISIRDAAKAMGVPHKVLWRFERGDDVVSSHSVKIMTWLLTGEHSKNLKPKAVHKPCYE